MLILSSLLVVVAGVVFALTDWLPLLILAGVVGVISPTGNEVGPFLAVEQASLTQVVPDAPTHGDLRLVQPRGLRRDGDRRARRLDLLGQALISAGMAATSMPTAPSSWYMPRSGWRWPCWPLA